MSAFAEKQTQPAKQPSVPPIVREVTRAPGRPLDAATRRDLEPRFGRDFGHVRVHTDARADEAASALDARAFTLSPHIAFRAGEYAPRTDAGLRLLAHELTHVAQQQAGVQRKDAVGRPGDAFEREADAVADAVVAGTDRLPAVGEMTRGAPAVQRQTAPGKGPAKRSDDPKSAPAKTKKPSPPDLSLGKLLSRLGNDLARLERKLMGNATQGWGFMFWGSSGAGSKESTAATPTKDGFYVDTDVDLSVVTEMMGLIVLVVSRPSEIFYKPKDMGRKPFKLTYDLKKKVDAIEKAREEERRKADKDKASGASPLLGIVRDARIHAEQTAQAAQAGKDKGGAPIPIHDGPTIPKLVVKDGKPGTTPAKKGPKVEVRQWVAHDAFNTYVKIEYSDHTIRYKMGSVFGIQEIDDPGFTDWELVPKTAVTLKTAQTTSSTSGSASTAGLKEEMVQFIEALKSDPEYGDKVSVRSTVRDPARDARAVLKNQKNDPTYYKIFSANWETAILAAVKDRNLSVAGDFEAAVSDLAAWIAEKPERSAHGSGRAVDFGLAGGDAGFKAFLRKAAEDRGFKFIDESSKNHYHVQM